MPLSTKGLADGLAKIATALERIEVVNGHVVWTAAGVPRLFFDAGGASSILAGEGAAGGMPTGYEEREGSVIDIQWDASGTKLQCKRGTVLVKDADSSWSDLLDFELYTT